MDSQSKVSTGEFFMQWSLASFLFYIGTAVGIYYFPYVGLAIVIGAFFVGLIQSYLLRRLDLKDNHWLLTTVLASALAVLIGASYFSPAGPSFVQELVKTYGYGVTASYIISFFVVFKFTLSLGQSIVVYRLFGARFFWRWLVANFFGIAVYCFLIGLMLNNMQIGRNGGLDYWFLTMLPQWIIRWPLGWLVFLAIFISNALNAVFFLRLAAAENSKRESEPEFHKALAH